MTSIESGGIGEMFLSLSRNLDVSRRNDGVNLTNGVSIFLSMTERSDRMELVEATMGLPGGLLSRLCILGRM